MKHENDWRGEHFIRCATPRPKALDLPPKQPVRKPIDPDRVAKISAHAEAGRSIGETADALGLTYWAVAMCATRSGIRFVNRRNGLRPAARTAP